MKKIVSLILVLAMAMCFGATAAVADEQGEKVTIQFWHSMSGTNADSILSLIHI